MGFIWLNCRVFTRRKASPRPTKRDGFHLAFTWEKLALLPGLARLAEPLGLTTFIFPRNSESDICVQVFILYPRHKQTELVKLSKKCWSRQFVVGGGPALLSAFIWEISSPPRRDLG